MDVRYRVCICGGGNISHALSALLGSREELEVYILTRKPENWSENIIGHTPSGDKVIGKPAIITDDASLVIPKSDAVFVTVPAFARVEILQKIAPYVKKGAWVGSFPGSGGYEWMAKAILRSDVNIFGLQRVPYISRTIEYGKEVNVTGIKDELFVSAIAGSNIEEIVTMLKYIFEVEISPLNNYLEVTLSTSNPILHPSRLYGMFHDWKEGNYWDRKILFYEEWDEFSSEILLRCDEEVQELCSKIPVNLSGVKSLREHYESKDKYAMTKKLTSINAFKGIPTDMLLTSQGYMPNFKSRYFTEDIPYGLIILKGIAEIVGCDTPTIDLILEWAQKNMCKEYIINGKLIGKDVKETAAPQNFNIKTINQLLDFYGVKA